MSKKKTLIEKALALAVEAHAGEVDKGGAPYILHPLRVMAAVPTMDEKIVAVLHDVVEDTHWTYEDLLKDGFPQRIVEALRALTKSKEPKESRIDAAKRAAADPIARVVKLADVTDNMDLSRIPDPTVRDRERLEEYRRVKALLLASTGAAAWDDLETRLAEALGALEEDQYLILSAKRGYGYVQFAAQGSFGLRAEAVSNHYLPPEHALGEAELATMRELGWNEPTRKPSEPAPEGQSMGSPNFFHDFERPVHFADLARVAIRTLVEALHVSHPGSLEYEARDRDGSQILLPGLGLKHRVAAPKPAAPAEQTPARTRELLLQAARQGFEDPHLEFDKDGDLAMRFGSAMVFVRVHESPHCISVFSPVLSNPSEPEGVVARLNELNAGLRYVRLFLTGDVVFAAMEVPAVPFVAQHVLDACVEIGRVADGIDDMLQAQFGGRTAFGEFRGKATLH